MTDTTAEIIWVSGPVMRSSGGQFLSMYETVEVGAARLIGEVIALDGAVATLQIYEDTGGIRPGDPVVGQGAP
jgi:V/A-type H+-transporting ATPase subunit A